MRSRASSDAAARDGVAVDDADAEEDLEGHGVGELGPRAEAAVAIVEARLERARGSRQDLRAELRGARRHALHAPDRLRDLLRLLLDLPRCEA